MHQIQRDHHEADRDAAGQGLEQIVLPRDRRTVVRRIIRFAPSGHRHNPLIAASLRNGASTATPRA